MIPFLLMFVAPIMVMFTNKQINYAFKLIIFLVMLAPLLLITFISYFNNRLLYTLCLKNIL